MRAMVLAAGRGERLRPLTDTLPKPLVEVGGETLIERHLRALAGRGVREVVINVSHLADLIEQRLGDGGGCGVHLTYSREPDGPLETAGGIVRALPLLGDAPFLLVNADVWTDFDFAVPPPPAAGGHIVLVPNPAHHPDGDFDLVDGRVRRAAATPYTYAGIACFDPAAFAGCAAGRAPLAPLLFALTARNRLAGSVHRGRWYDIGTPERLAAARAGAGTPGDPAGGAGRT